MIGLMERLVEDLSGEFYSQAVANTLWAFATMGRMPRERIIELLETHAEAMYGESNLGVAHLGVQSHRQISPGKVASARDKNPAQKRKR